MLFLWISFNLTASWPQCSSLPNIAFSQTQANSCCVVRQSWAQWKPSLQTVLFLSSSLRNSECQKEKIKLPSCSFCFLLNIFLNDILKHRALFSFSFPHSLPHPISSLSLASPLGKQWPYIFTWSPSCNLFVCMEGKYTVTHEPLHLPKLTS